MTHKAHDILFPALPYDMHERSRAASRDVQLQQFVNHATRAKDAERRGAMGRAFGERVGAVRELAAELRQHALDHLDHYLAQFVDNAERAGACVHFAADAAEANAIVSGIARQHGLARCVKSKSMATEEIGLLPALEAAGLEVVETDLAEFILQLDDDAPSHIVTAMIHKDRVATARVFAQKLGAPYTEDPTELTMIARAHLREVFRRADLGVSGGNFLVAETGSVVLCTNEGNGRLCTALPPVHVAVVGIEKLVANLEHLSVLLKVLARSSTAQELTCYTQLITGPRRGDDGDGPRHVHVVLLDNGRTRALGSDSREMLRCIRCGACLNACPVYRKVGGHAYGSVYSGPIGAILTPTMRGLAEYHDLPHASSLCGACFEACPVRIDIPAHLVRLRAQMFEDRTTGWKERLGMRLWAWTLKKPWRYRVASFLQRIVLRRRCGWITRGRGPIRAWTDARDMPAPASRDFRHWWQQEHGDD